MIKMVVFDMAGTTVDEDNVVYKTLQKAINQEGFSFTLNQVLAQGAGKEKLQAIKSVLSVYAGIADDKLSGEIFKKFMELLEEAYAMLDIRPQASAVELFSALKERGVLVILNTGYNIKTAQSIVAKLGWERGVEFDGLITATDVEKKPS